jgi:hypothetical protein
VQKMHELHPALSAFKDMGIPPEDENELAQACHECRQHGWQKAAAILAREWALQIKAARKPRKKLVEVKLAHGGKAWLDRERVRDAEEIED